MIRVRFYGKMRRIFGEEMEMEASSIKNLLKKLEEKSEKVKNLREHLIFSVNGEEAGENSKIKDGDEVAIFVSPTGG